MTNLRVGARLLQGLLQSTTTVDDALYLYAMDAGQSEDNTYVDKVLTEQKLLDKVIATLPAPPAARSKNKPA